VELNQQFQDALFVILNGLTQAADVSVTCHHRSHRAGGLTERDRLLPSGGANVLLGQRRQRSSS